MKPYYSRLIVALHILIHLIGCGQEKISKTSDLNLDFEQHENAVPLHWKSSRVDDSNIYVDSIQSKGGTYSLKLENTNDSTAFKLMYITLPHNYIGDSIKISGYIKTENVTNGYAGLWMKIHPQIAFDNMYDKGVKGTKDWEKFEISLALAPQKTETIFVGTLLSGRGKAWFDDLHITVDGQDVEYYKSAIPAKNDKEFDNGSNVVFPMLDKINVENLELLGRVWGFLKYYHPVIAKGECNWDYELFRILPDYLKVQNNQERDLLLIKWIEKYGKVPKNNTVTEASNKIFIKSNTSWVDDSNISIDLNKMLKYIYDNRNQGDNYYVAIHPIIGNLQFTNEELYSNMPYPDTGFRLLALYRYWNMIEYFFPYKYLTDKKWDIILKEYIPLLLEAKDELAYELAATQLVADINDSHAYVSAGNDKLHMLRGGYYPAFETRFVENKLVVTDVFRSSRLKLADIITTVNGKSVEMIVDSLRPYYRASNENATRRPIAIDILRSSDKEINVSFISSGKLQHTKLKLYPYDEFKEHYSVQVTKGTPTFKLLKDSIGYLSLASIRFQDIGKLKDTLSSLKGLVIDIRNYPNQHVALDLASIFLSKASPFVKILVSNINKPGDFYFRTAMNIEPVKFKYNDKNRNVFRGKIVVLVNEYTQSRAEFTAMALRVIPNSLIIGSQTSGADGDFSDIYLPGGIKTGISGTGVYYPDGRQTQRIGIIPDVIVKPTVEGVRNRKDEVFEKAIKILNN